MMTEIEIYIFTCIKEYYLFLDMIQKSTELNLKLGK